MNKNKEFQKLLHEPGANIVDADTGFGNAINVIRTVREFERAGVSAIQLEDQVSPKKCGHFNGKQVISREEMVYKVKAALDTRVDENVAIIARTDTLAVSGIEDALERAHAYAEAGADITFVEAPTTIGQLQQITSSLKGIHQVLNLVEGGKTPLISLKEAEAIGFKVVILCEYGTPVSDQSNQRIFGNTKRRGGSAEFIG